MKILKLPRAQNIIYVDAEAIASGPQATMILQRKSMEECKEETETGYYRISHVL